MKLFCSHDSIVIRVAIACDTCFEITPARAQLLKNNGYNMVGRYLRGYISDTRPKALQDGELEVVTIELVFMVLV